MLRPVTMRTTGPSSSGSCGSAARAAPRRALDADPGVGEGDDGSGNLAPRSTRSMCVGDVVQDIDRVRDRDPDGEAVGEGRGLARSARLVLPPSCRPSRAPLPRRRRCGASRGERRQDRAADRRRAARRSRPGRRRPRAARRAGRGSRRRSPRSPRTAPARRRPRRTARRARVASACPSSLASSMSAPSRRISAPSRSRCAELRRARLLGRRRRRRGDRAARPPTRSRRRGCRWTRSRPCAPSARSRSSVGQRPAPLERTELVHVLALEPDVRRPRRGSLERVSRSRVSRMPAVQLFATCLGDLAFPDAVADAESLLRAGGLRGRVSAPRRSAAGSRRSTPGTGRRRAGWRGRSCARSRASCPIVVPSGSCATMASHYLPELARRRAVRGVGAVGVPRRTRASGRCRGTTGAGSPTTTRATCCASCGSRRSRDGCSAASGAELVPFARPDLCCGFGGTFSVRQPEVSVAMADDKLAGGDGAATLVTADPGCLMHLRGRAGEGRVARAGRPPRDRARAGVTVT